MTVAEMLEQERIDRAELKRDRKAMNRLMLAMAHASEVVPSSAGPSGKLTRVRKPKA